MHRAEWVTQARFIKIQKLHKGWDEGMARDVWRNYLRDGGIARRRNDHGQTELQLIFDY